LSCHLKSNNRSQFQSCKKSSKNKKLTRHGKRILRFLKRFKRKYSKKLIKGKDSFIYTRLNKLFRLLKVKSLGHKVLFDLFHSSNMMSVIEVYGVLSNLGTSSDETENRARRRKVRVFGELKQNFASLDYLVNEANFGGLLLMGLDDFYRSFFHPFRRGGLPYTSVHEFN
ncbi:hypothetical protein N9N67_09705, partial [Bacteriovoracaceae bacterium]|nr:hypothetical protein [Bacteriovoracaceae bacterium]